MLCQANAWSVSVSEKTHWPQSQMGQSRIADHVSSCQFCCLSPPQRPFWRRDYHVHNFSLMFAFGDWLDLKDRDVSSTSLWLTRKGWKWFRTFEPVRSAWDACVSQKPPKFKEGYVMKPGCIMMYPGCFSWNNVPSDRVLPSASCRTRVYLTLHILRYYSDISDDYETSFTQPKTFRFFQVSSWKFNIRIYGIYMIGS